MKTELDFRNYYDNTIAGQVTRLSGELRWAKAKKQLSLVLIISINIFFILNVILNPTASAGALAFSILLFSSVVYFGVNYQSSTRFEDDFKDTVTRGIVNFVDPNLSYGPDDSLPQAIFETSNIFSTGFATYDGSDYIEGTEDGIYIQASMVDLTTPDALVKTQFRGIFFVAEFNKNFNGQTFIMPKVKSEIVEKSTDKLHIGRPPLMEMENPAFNKIFAAFADDPIEGRYIISPAMMEKVLAMKGKIPDDLYISFVESKMYVAIDLKNNVFNPRIAVKSYENMLELFNYLNLTLDIVSEFDLNRKIWGKA